jgi:hypothetical protein
MIEKLINLTEKEREKVFSRKGRVKVGDYLYYSNHIYEVLYADRNSKTYLVYTPERSYIIWEKNNVKSAVKVNNTLFQKLKQEWVEKHLIPSTEEGKHKLLTNILSSIYKEEDFDIICVEPEQFNVIIHYPEIEITNSLGMSHTIRDLYFGVSIYFRDKINILDFRIARTTFEEREYNGKYFYIYSHVDEEQYPEMLLRRRFCFGSTELKFFVDSAENSGISIFKIKQFFHYMNSYFKWESLEGIPFHKMYDIGSLIYKPSVINENIIQRNSSAFLNIVKNIIREMESFKFSFSNNDIQKIDILAVNDVYSLEEFINQEIYIEEIPEDFKCYIVGGNPVESIENIFKNDIKKIDNKEARFKFKESIPKMKIIPTENIIAEKVVHPTIIKEISNVISEKFKLYLLLRNGKEE